MFDDPSKPILVKMHGDFQSERLDNTNRELTADNDLRTALSEAMRTKGLIVVGYSGRDESVMNALTKAMDAPQAFSPGLFWVTKEGDARLPSVTRFLTTAREKGIEAHVVESPSFEELMANIRYLLPATERQKAHFDRFQPASRASDFDIPARGGRWPRLRLNAIAVADYPKTARLVLCDIGGTKEVQTAIADAGVNAVAARRKDGVIAFGEDEALLEALRPWDPKLDYGKLDPSSPSDLGLLYDALILGLAAQLPLEGRGKRKLVIKEAKAASNFFQPLPRCRPFISGGEGSWFGRYLG